MSISNSNFDKRRIKNKITLCDKTDHNNIKDIFKKYNHKKYTKNKNGYFINLDSVPYNVLKEVEDYIDQSIKERNEKYNSLEGINNTNYNNYNLNTSSDNLSTNENDSDIPNENSKSYSYDIENEEEMDKEEQEQENFDKDDEGEKDKVLFSNKHNYDSDDENDNDNNNDNINDDNDEKSFCEIKLTYPLIVNNIIKRCRDIQKKSNMDTDMLYSNYKEYDDDDEDDNNDELSEDSDYTLF